MAVAHVKTQLKFFWFRRDMRMHDNHGLSQALATPGPVQAIFILDQNILKHLEPTDFRMSFLHKRLAHLKSELQSLGSDLWVFHGEPLKIWQDLLKKYSPAAVYSNNDYEPYAKRRDQAL